MDLEEGRLAVELARRSAEAFLSGKKLTQVKEGGKAAFSSGSLPHVFQENRGAFVTLHTYPDRELRGCIGYPEPVFPLEKALAECAVHACQDPRFDPVAKSELSKIIFEVSILTKPQLIECPPSDYPKHVKTGEDGLIIRKGPRSGLLLPQVATEYSFSPQEFLEHTCMKAGLDSQAWKEKDCKIYKFQAEIFSEKAPDGKVERCEDG
jgi:uncharacterized protein (TIGR00296 family)